LIDRILVHVEANECPEQNCKIEILEIGEPSIFLLQIFCYTNY